MVWDGHKERGYGILVISINNLRFGIPLRSYMKHRFGFHTVESKGLDYSKAVLLSKDEYICNLPFMILMMNSCALKIKSRFIEKKFTDLFKAI